MIRPVRWSGGFSTVQRVACALMLAWLLYGGAAFAQERAPGNLILSIDVETVGAQTMLTIGLKEPLRQAPLVFMTQDPARIAIDFSDTGFARARAQYGYNGKMVKRASIVHIAQRSRIVLDLSRAGSYTTQVQGNRFMLLIDNDPPGRERPSTSVPRERMPQQTSPDDVAGRRLLRDIDFRRGPDGAGQIAVELSKRGTGIDIARRGQRVVVDFLDTELPVGLRRRIDVADFGTPVRSLEAVEQQGNTRLTIEPEGNWEYSSYQTDNRFVVQVQPASDDPARSVDGPRYAGERLSLNFQNIDIRSLLQVFAEFTGLNIVTSDAVQGTLTLRLKNVPWDQALQIVLDAKGLASRRNGNVLRVAPKAELTASEKQEMESRRQITELEPIRSQVYRLNYQRAEDVRRMLLGADSGWGETGGAEARDVAEGGVGAAGAAGTRPAGRPGRVPGAQARMLSRRGSLTADPRTNQLFVSDAGSKLEEVQRFLLRIDVPVRQVMIEARIVEADDKFSQNLGAKLGFAGSFSRGRAGDMYGDVLPGATSTEGPMLSLPAAAIHGSAAASFAVSLFSRAAARFLALELSALEAEGKGRIVSSPRVVTANNIKALIEQGTELPYQAATSSGATSVQFRKANLKLEVTPQITPEGHVLLDVDVNKDSVGVQTTQGFAIDTRHVQTQVLVENGGTVVIGGIYTLTERTDVGRVPVLGEIPVVGQLFRHSARVSDRTELLVFLTPRILSDSQ